MTVPRVRKTKKVAETLVDASLSEPVGPAGLRFRISSPNDSHRPKMGDPDYRRLLDVSVKIASNEPLNRKDRDWLSALLAMIQSNNDVRPFFFKTAKGRPDDYERLFWIAMDVARHREEMKAEAAYLRVATLWGLAAGTVENISKKMKTVIVEQPPLLKTEWAIKRFRDKYKA